MNRSLTSLRRHSIYEPTPPRLGRFFDEIIFIHDIHVINVMLDPQVLEFVLHLDKFFREAIR
jgi:hypothetical protein